MRLIDDTCYNPLYQLEDGEVPTLETFVNVSQRSEREADILVPVKRNEELRLTMIAGGCKHTGQVQKNIEGHAVDFTRWRMKIPESGLPEFWDRTRAQQTFEEQTRAAAAKAAIDARPYSEAFPLLKVGWKGRFDDLARETMIWVALNHDLENNKTWSSIIPMFGSTSSYQWSDENLRTFLRKVRDIHASKRAAK